LGAIVPCGLPLEFETNVGVVVKVRFVPFPSVIMSFKVNPVI